MTPPFLALGADSIDVLEVACWMEETNPEFDVNTVRFAEVNCFDDLLFQFIQRGGNPEELAANMEKDR